MTQEEKSLLLQDLCARLPYHVRLKIWLKDGTTEEGFLDLEHNYGDVLRDTFYYNKILDIKPYLRLMSNMTEEEKRELSSKYNWNIKGNDISIRYHSEGYWDDDTECPTNEYLNLFDWLNKNQFDYRGLIPKGLAIEVTKENNPYEN